MDTASNLAITAPQFCTARRLSDPATRLTSGGAADEAAIAIRAIVKRGAPYQAHNAFGYLRRLYNWAIGTHEFGIETSPVERLIITLSGCCKSGKSDRPSREGLPSNSGAAVAKEVHPFRNGSGHNITQRVFVECGSMYHADGQAEMKPVGEIEFVNGTSAMSASGQYGKNRLCAGIIGHADLRLGDGVARVLEAEIAASSRKSDHSFFPPRPKLSSSGSNPIPRPSSISQPRT